MIFTIAIVIIFALALIPSLSDQTNKLSSLATITQDNFTMSNNTCVQVATGCIDAISSVINQTQASGFLNPVGSGNYTVCRSSTGNADGINVRGSDAVINNLNGLTLTANYTLSPDCTYIANNTVKNLATLPLLFYILAVVIIVIGYVFRTEIFQMFGGN